MKRKDIKLLHSKSVDELKVVEKELTAELIRLRKELEEKKLKNISLIKSKSDDLARVKTEIAGRE